MGGERQLHEERRTAEEGSLVRDGWSEFQKAMVIHPPSRERVRRCPPVRPSVRCPWQIGEGYAGYAIKRGEREKRRKKKKGGSALGRRASEERSNRCQLGEMREERGDDDDGDHDDERRAAAVGTVLIG